MWAWLIKIKDVVLSFTGQNINNLLSMFLNMVYLLHLLTYQHRWSGTNWQVTPSNACHPNMWHWWSPSVSPSQWKISDNVQLLDLSSGHDNTQQLWSENKCPLVLEWKLYAIEIRTIDLWNMCVIGSDFVLQVELSSSSYYFPVVHHRASVST